MTIQKYSGNIPFRVGMVGAGFMAKLHGCSDQQFVIFLCRDVTFVGLNDEQDEVIEARWFSAGEIMALITSGEMIDGLSLTPLLFYFATETVLLK
ncbi:hypothetical protein PCO85_21535 [Prodigiosinella aquatilis]|nr:hypothetical protein [Prodigiosinella sp. LS101]WJV53689.1 hypothetical protein PCO85_21535 [Prodigiosinella sp. LS101]WJV58048.1 hypothetical protein PCO84_21510 [Pectobacteriaceae bacterium C111]